MKPKAKRVEKIIPIEVSSPILVFLTIKPRNIATTIAAGAPSSEILNPKKTPTAIIAVSYTHLTLPTNREV